MLLRRVFENKLRSGLFAAAAALISTAWLWAWLELNDQASQLVVHFNNAGLVQIGTLTYLHRAAATGIIVVALNFWIALELEERDRFWGAFVAGATLLFAVLLFIGFAAIINAN